MSGELYPRHMLVQLEPLM